MEPLRQANRTSAHGQTGPLMVCVRHQEWAGNRANGGLSVHRGANSETLTGYAAQRAEGHPMRKQKKPRLTVTVNVDLAACLRALAFLAFLFT